MTRWAKAGTSQKHKKLPGDSTPWDELSKGIQGKFKSKRKFRDNFKKKNSEPSSLSEDDKEKSCGELNSQKINEYKSKKYFSVDEKASVNKVNICDNEGEAKDTCIEIKKKRKMKERDDEVINSGNENFKNNSKIDDNLAKKKKIKRKKEKEPFSFAKAQDPSRIEGSTSLEKNFKENRDSSENTQTELHLNKKLSKRKKRKLEKEKVQSNPNLSLEIAIEKANDQKLPSAEKLSEKKRLEKKQWILKKRKERRKQLGIMLLPTNIENRIYRMKKALRRKNFPPEKIKEIIREERIKAQNEFRKTHASKICFNCREWGHLLANCPKISNEEVQETGMCFRCGSTEHTSAKCKKKVQGFPFASCFICKTQGHISRNCPSNSRGIYPKGGKCNLCDSINHLRKDCPTLKKTVEESSITLHTIDNGVSIDDELVEVGESTKKNKSKMPKVVTF